MCIRDRFTVVNSSGVAVSSSLLNVTATRTISAVGAAVNDPLDLGQTYPLNLTIPSAGAFTINIEYLNGATIFRNNVNTVSYTHLDVYKRQMLEIILSKFTLQMLFQAKLTRLQFLIKEIYNVDHKLSP